MKCDHCHEYANEICSEGGVTLCSHCYKLLLEEHLTPKFVKQRLKDAKQKKL